LFYLKQKSARFKTLAGLKSAVRKCRHAALQQAHKLGRSPQSPKITAFEQPSVFRAAERVRERHQAGQCHRDEPQNVIINLARNLESGTTTMRLLLIEDDKKISAFVRKGLVEAGFAVDCAFDGRDGLDLALSGSYDTSVVDIMLPALDGLFIIAKMRDRKVNTPVLVLSAKRSVDERVRGLQAGGDDYLIKPFAFSELLARVQALVRRATGAVEPTCLTFGDLSVDLLKREVVRGGRKIDLQPREFALLEYLMRNSRRVVSKTMILEHVWGYHFDPQTNVVDVLVCRLRKQLEAGMAEKLVHTVRGAGYVLKTS
jgi:DNA-binding response OmpR family regulator